jgi:hypothetical protein
MHATLRRPFFLLAKPTKTHYISTTMLNITISNTAFFLALLTSALLLRKLAALRAASLRTQKLR